MDQWGSTDPRNRLPDGRWASEPPRESPPAITLEEGEDDTEDFPQPGKLLPICLFALTVFTTLWAGAYQTNSNPTLGPWAFLKADPWALLRGVPFAATLLGILVTHEFGHYILSRIHRVPATFPLFIPGPPHFIGTFGAIIRMSPILNRKALFDIGVAGPIAGFVVSFVALVIGLTQSRIVHSFEVYDPVFQGPSLLVSFFVWLFFGEIPRGFVVDLHPMANAAWFGLFVTSLNLIPIGQLDGGHVAFALWGNRQRTIALATVPALLILGFIGWPGWFLWVALGSALGISHPPVVDPREGLGSTRIWLGRGALLIFILTFAPIPFIPR